ncbi:MAG TPA: tRNA uridine-5-carboxymethylaminomethyl(34) synthesis GTPase MnmE, partial [Flavobacteriales bacterium]|nr:tRNA uridine-5-carboxymethylaminomethyl(34) synthesis GTPase MnmE [Flavobacteriales bacterium]
VQEVASSIEAQIGTELLAQYIKAALEHLGEITGEVTNDEILGNIFSRFCIGK